MICAGSSSCQWHTSDGITFGTTLQRLEQLNGRPFVLAGFGWDYSGTVLNWNSGGLNNKLQSKGRLLLRLDSQSLVSLTKEQIASVMGDKDIPSSFPVMQKLNPRIYAMDFEFP